MTLNLMSSILVAGVWLTLVQTTRPNIDQETATDPVPQRDFRAAHFARRHDENLRRAAQGDVDLLFVGDSLTENWERVPQLWQKFFGRLKPANFGVGGDRTQNVLWRMQNGELDHISPRVVVLLVGTNNLGRNAPPAVAEGIRRVVETIRSKQPAARVLLLGILPRDAGGPELGRQIASINRELAKLDDGKFVRYLDLGPKFLDPDGKIPESVMPDGLHLNENGYRILGESITPSIQDLMR